MKTNIFTCVILILTLSLLASYGTIAFAADDLSIEKGTEYAYMTDEWNVYIAKAISNNAIKIENWNKTMSNSKSVSHEYDVGTFKINDIGNNFSWVDNEHTTFVITFKDKKNSNFRKGGTATFTINISDSNNNKGSNFSEDIACFTYTNDDWHMYRAIPMTETLIKIECWSRGFSIGKHLFGYDVCLIDTTSKETDFEWTDDEKTSFSITMKDKNNKFEWRKETCVFFVLENKDYTHFDVKSFLGKWEIGEGETAVPESSFDFKYDNFKDVQKKLESVGFTNITTSILYDIIWGWTQEGEVDSVSIDGNVRYDKGEVFSKDAPIIITYHMKMEDDPNKKIEVETTATNKPYTKSTVTETPVVHLTIDNSPSLASILCLDRERNASAIRNFAAQHKGDIIELELLTAFVEHNKNYKTRFNYLLYAIVEDRVMLSGPSFMFKDVNYSDLKLKGTNVPDSFGTGIHCTVTAEIEGYEDGMILLDPISIYVVKTY